MLWHIREVGSEIKEKREMQTKEQRIQEENDIERDLKAIRVLIISETRKTYYCDLTELAFLIMELELTTQSILTQEQWLEDTKDVILNELTKMTGYYYLESEDCIYRY